MFLKRFALLLGIAALGQHSATAADYGTIYEPQPIAYAPRAYYSNPQPYYAPPAMAYQPVFAVQPVGYGYYVPQTVLVQRPVGIAQPVFYPEPVFVGAPLVQAYAAPAPVMVQTYAPPVVSYPAYSTSVSYRGPLWPFGSRDKLEYQVRTPYGKYKYKYRTSWRNGTTKFEFDFDD